MGNEVKLIITTDAEEAQKLLNKFGDDATVMGDKAAKGSEAGRLGFFALGNAVEDTARSFGVAGQASRQMGNSIERVAASAFPMWGAALGVATLVVMAAVSIAKAFNNEIEKSRTEILKAGDQSQEWVKQIYGEEKQTRALTQAIIEQTTARRAQAAFDIEQKVALQKQILIEKQRDLNKLEKKYADLVKGLGDDMPTGYLAIAVFKKRQEMEQLVRDINNLKADIKVAQEEKTRTNKPPVDIDHEKELTAARGGLVAYRGWVIALQDEQKKIAAENRAEEWGNTLEMLGRRTALVIQHKQNELDAEASYTSAVAQFSQARGDLIEEQQQREVDAFDAAAAAKYNTLQTFDEQQAFLAENEINRAALTAAQEKQLYQMRMQTASNAFGNMANASKLMYEQGGAQARKYFELYKIASMAQTAIHTYEAAVAAYKSLAGIPYVGPALGAAAAAAAIAFGLAQVNAIRSQSFSSASISGGGGAIGTYPANPATGLPESGAQTQPLNLTIIVNGEEKNINEIAAGVLSEVYRNNGTLGGFTVAVERSA